MSELCAQKAVIFYPHIASYGGIERNIVGLAAEVLRRRLKPVLLCYYDKVGMGQYAEGLETHVMGDHSIPWVKAIRLRSALAKQRIDMAGSPFFFDTKAGFYGALARLDGFVFHYTDPPSLLTPLASVTGVRGLLRALRQKLAHAVNRSAINRASRCLTMTRWNARELQELYGRSFEVIYQGGLPGAGLVGSHTRCARSMLRLFSICRLTQSKNLDWILHATKSLVDDESIRSLFPEIRVIIAGEGPAVDDLKHLAGSLSLQRLVEFPGFLTLQQVEEQYAQADLLLVPGRQGYGLPVLEALYRRVPVVLNRESRISEILENQPWVAISDNTCVSFVSTCKRHILDLRETPADESTLRDLPTESAWANLIGRACGWW